MKAMILAAGVGSRLRPLTDKIPKALIEIGGKPMLEIVIGRLKNAGVTEIIVNTHHKAEIIVDFLKAKKNFGLRLEISHEPELLDTGGGLKKAAWFFSGGGPFLLHNVDVLSGIDFKKMLKAHEGSGALATLAVQKRQSGRYLLFSGNGILCGREADGKTEWAGTPYPQARKLGFAGIHVISPAFLEKITEEGIFSINKTYLRLTGQGEKIQAFPADDYYWADIGNEAKLEAARAYAQKNGLPA